LFSSLDSVKIENLTQSTSLVIQGGTQLNLVGPSGSNDLLLPDLGVKIIPNPMSDNAKVLFYAKQSGETQFSIYDMMGREILYFTSYSNLGLQKYLLSGLSKGVYLVNVQGLNYQYHVKIISENSNQLAPKLFKISFENQVDISASKNNIVTNKGGKNVVMMAYNDGDNLKYTGYKSLYNLFQTDIPTFNKTITFNFTSLLITKDVTAITAMNATSGGVITDDGGCAISFRGICWSTTHNPVITDNNDGAFYDGGAYSFNCNLNQLSPNTTYYVRAAIYTNTGYIYGNEVSFTTPNICTNNLINDVDGNVYQTVRIGNQCWLQQNLKSTKFNDNTFIPQINNDTLWNISNTPSYCWYNNDTLNYDIYGALYNINVIDKAKNGNKNICPLNWHVSTNQEWESAFWLFNNCGTSNPFKEVGTEHWNYPNFGATNLTGFSALPGGERSSGSSFERIRENGYWWTPSKYCDYDSNYVSVWTMSFSDAYLSSMGYGRNWGCSIRCVKDYDGIVSVPDVITDSVITVTNYSAYSGGVVLNENGSFVTARGVCWSKTPNPTVNDNDSLAYLAPYLGTGAFSSHIIDLSPNTTYYLRAFATNSVGTGYGNEFSFTTLDVPNCGTAIDGSGNVYQTVILGTQCWLKQNLKTTKYNDNSPIPLVTDDTQWRGLSTPGYCWLYNDSVTYGNLYGGLYNLYAVRPSTNGNKNVCPLGWHVPSDNEWDTLEMFLGLPFSEVNITTYRGTNEGSKLAGNDTLWTNGALDSNNRFGASGFCALPGNQRDCYTGAYTNSSIFGEYGYWWSTTIYVGDSYTRSLSYNNAGIYRHLSTPQSGYSVRCLKD
jgi:uncharacterized protein (TIGR02145 family)